MQLYVGGLLFIFYFFYFFCETAWEINQANLWDHNFDCEFRLNLCVSGFVVNMKNFLSEISSQWYVLCMKWIWVMTILIFGSFLWSYEKYSVAILNMNMMNLRACLGALSNLQMFTVNSNFKSLQFCYFKSKWDDFFFKIA